MDWNLQIVQKFVLISTNKQTRIKFMDSVCNWARSLLLIMTLNINLNYVYKAIESRS